MWKHTAQKYQMKMEANMKHKKCQIYSSRTDSLQNYCPASILCFIGNQINFFVAFAWVCIYIYILIARRGRYNDGKLFWNTRNNIF